MHFSWSAGSEASAATLAASSVIVHLIHLLFYKPINLKTALDDLII